MILDIFFLGDSLVGKTTIIDRYISGEFHDKEPLTVNVCFYKRDFQITSRVQSLKIIDSSGQKKFRSFLLSYLHDIDVAVLVYDVTNYSSFENLDTWLNLVAQYENLPKFIVGSKIDLEEKREVAKEDAQRYADQHQCQYIEVSSLTGENIESLFSAIAHV